MSQMQALDWFLDATAPDWSPLATVGGIVGDRTYVDSCGTRAGSKPANDNWKLLQSLQSLLV